MSQEIVQYDNVQGSSIPASKKWSSRFPCYQIDFTAVASGKMVATTKRRIRWRFGFPNGAALDAGETGTACRGEEHDITIVWSIASGKRMILADGHEIHYSSNRGGEIDFSWTMKGNHILKVIAHAAPPLTATPGFRQYDLFIDGQSFFLMPKVFELGLKGPPSAVARVPGVYHPAAGAPQQEPTMHYDLRTGQYIRAPRSPEEEERDLQAAIQASLEESRSFLSTRANSQNANSVQQKSAVASVEAPALKVGEPDLLGFFTEPSGPPLQIEGGFQGVNHSLSFDSRSEAQSNAIQPYQQSSGANQGYNNYNVAVSASTGVQASNQFTEAMYTAQQPSQFNDSFTYAPPNSATDSFTYAPPPTFADFGATQPQRQPNTFGSPAGQSQAMQYQPSSDSKASYGGAPVYSPFSQAPPTYASTAQPYNNFQMSSPQPSTANPPPSNQPVYSLTEASVAEPTKQLGLDGAMKKLVNFDDISSDPAKELSKMTLTMNDGKSTAGWGGTQATLGQMQATKKVRVKTRIAIIYSVTLLLSLFVTISASISLICEKKACDERSPYSTRIFGFA